MGHVHAYRTFSVSPALKWPAPVLPFRAKWTVVVNAAVWVSTAVGIDRQKMRRHMRSSWRLKGKVASDIESQPNFLVCEPANRNRVTKGDFITVSRLRL